MGVWAELRPRGCDQRWERRAYACLVILGRAASGLSRVQLLIPSQVDCKNGTATGSKHFVTLLIGTLPTLLRAPRLFRLHSRLAYPSQGRICSPAANSLRRSVRWPTPRSAETSQAYFSAAAPRAVAKRRGQQYARPRPVCSVKSAEKGLAGSGAPARRGPLAREHGSTAHATRVVVGTTHTVSCLGTAHVHLWWLACIAVRRRRPRRLLHHTHATLQSAHDVTPYTRNLTITAHT